MDPVVNPLKKNLGGKMAVEFEGSIDTEPASHRYHIDCTKSARKMLAERRKKALEKYGYSNGEG